MDRLRHFFPQFLMSVSLLLLATFLIWFAHRIWHEEWENLQRRGDNLLLNTVRDLESETFNRLIFKKKKALRSLEFMPKDSIRAFTLITDNHAEISVKNDSQPGHTIEQRVVDIQLNAPANLPKGALSVVLSLKDSTDHLPWVQDSSSTYLFDQLHAGIGAELAQNGLPFGYYLLKNNLDSAASPLAISSYIDIVSRERYDLFFTEYQGWLWWKIAPQLLFALLLFGSTALAFFIIEKNLRQQKRLTELKNDFIRNITHELKTPIATAGVAVEALRSFGAMDNRERADEYLSITQSELSRLSILVEKVLRMSAMDGEEATLKPEHFDFGILVEEILHSLKLPFEKRRAKLQVEMPDGQYPVFADRLHLAGVVYNLLDNALKYSPDNPEVRVHLAKTPTQLLFQVADNGPGIPVEYQSKIFDRFFRIPTGNIHNVKGHGLGLNYVHGVVRRHNGDITVHSRDGQGAVFTVSLPLNSVSA